MKKTIAILALVLMIFAVSCSNDTPSPANDVPQKADLAVATPAVPETPTSDEVLAQFSKITSTISGSYTEAESDSWSNFYDSNGTKVFTRVDGTRYLTVDGNVLRAGDSVSYNTYQGNFIITVNDVVYTATTTQGKKYIEDYNDLLGTVVKTVTSTDVEKVFILSEEVTEEGQTEPTTREYTITVKGKMLTTYDWLEENEELDSLSSCEVDITISPAYGELTAAKLNVYDVIETPEATEETPEPQPYMDTRAVLSVAGDSYDASESGLGSLLNSIFN